jgi:hypothetical protein
VILLSFVLVVVSATALGFGVFDTSGPLVWTSLVAGLGAVALIVGSVLRRRRELVPGAVPDAAGPATAGSVAVGSASAGYVPAPSPTPTRTTGTGSTAAQPSTEPVPPPGPWAGAPGSRMWPWATTPPGGSPDSRSGWTGPVPAAPPPPDRPAEASAATQPTDGPAVTRPDGDERPAEASVAPVQIPADPVTAPDESPPIEQKASWEAAAGESSADGEPAIERVTVRDALRVAQLGDEVVVVDGHPRYHLAGCPTLSGAEMTPLAVSVARRGGFTPCAVCGPDGTLLTRLRARNTDRADDSPPAD